MTRSSEKSHNPEQCGPCFGLEPSAAEGESRDVDTKEDVQIECVNVTPCNGV